MEKKLQELADKLGIATKFVDAGLIKKEYEIKDDIIRFLLDN